MTVPTLRDASTAQRPFFRRFLILLACIAFILIAAPIALYLWSSTDATQDLVRRRMIAMLEQSTGGRVQIASFHWHLLSLEADAGGLVIHGLEAPGETPLAQVDQMKVRLRVFGLWSPRILLRDLEISHPAFHLIVYSDGSTNMPQPRKPRKPGEHALDTIFNLQAGHISVQQGVLNFENRASEFDFQNRFTLFEFDARDVSALMRYIPPSGGDPEIYRIETGAAELNLARANEKPALGSMQGTLDLTRSAAHLRSLRITSKIPADKGHREEDHTFELSGVLKDFAHPQWQARTTGELDMRLLEPGLGFQLSPQGIAHLDLDSAGEMGEFRTDGSVHIDGGAYIGTGVVATDIQLDAHVHADPRQLLITRIVARLRQGGQLEGEVALTPWLPANPGATIVQRSGINSVRATGKPPRRRPSSFRLNPDVIMIPVNGKVTATFKDVSLDALLDMVGQPPFQRLGLDSLVNGTAKANWSKGDQQTVVVDSALNLSPSKQIVANEVPATGSVDATYTQRDGAVDLRKLELHTPASQIGASGHLGAYPLTSPSGLKVDFHSRNLAEFDTVLRDLGLNRYGKSGAAALPATLAGQGDFLGSWTGSLVDPHIAGTAKATQLAIEMIPVNAPAGKDGAVQSTPSHDAPPKLVHWDSVEATGSYAAERIVIQHGLLRRGQAEIAVDGTLDATPALTHESAPEFDANSSLHMHLRASKIGLDDLLQLTAQNLPLTGTLDAQFQANGPIHALGGSGWVELDNAAAYGEPITRIRAEGTLSNQLLKVTYADVGAPPGNLSATGSFDLKSRRFQLDAKGSGIDIARIDSLRRRNAEATGMLGFSISGSGTMEDPRLDAHATLNGLALGGESLGELVFAAHTANRFATYNATTRFEGAKIDLNGQTALSSDYATQAKLDFSHFNIGGLLKTAHVQGLTGESALAGTITVEGPLAHPRSSSTAKPACNN